MPEANSEIAMGMNSTSRNAVAHLIRSVSTARTSPSPVTATGATTTQITLFLNAVSVRRSVNVST